MNVGRKATQTDRMGACCAGRWARRRVAIAFAAGLGVVPAVAYANGPDVSDRDRANAAEAFVRDGLESYKRRDYEGALAQFSRAYQMAPTTPLVFNIALAELQAGHAVAAVRHLRLYARLPDAVAENVDAIRAKWLARAEAQTSRLQVVAPDGSAVFIDAKWAGRAPLDVVDVEPGPHEVTAEIGGQPQTAHVSARAGEVARLRFDASAAPSPVPSPALPAAVATEERPSGSAARYIVSGSLAGAALVSAGLGVWFAASSRSDASDASGLRSMMPATACGTTPPDPRCGALAQLVDDQHAHFVASTVLYGVAGAFAVASVATWLAWPAHAKAAIAWMVTPSVSAREAGAVVTHAF